MAFRPLRADDLFKTWSRKQFKRLYLFAGQEDFLIEEALTQLIAFRFADSTEATDRERLDGDSVSAEEIIESARTLPFLGTCRMILIENAHRLSSDHQKRLAEQLPNLPETSQVVFLWGREWRRDDADKPLVEAVQQCGDVVVFWPLFPEAAERWLLHRSLRYKKALAPEAAHWLVQESENSLRRLDMELEKASCFVGERPNITREDVQQCFGYSRAGSPYEWLDALRQRRAPMAVQILTRLLEEGEEPLRLLALASSAIRDWLTAQESTESPQLLGMRLRLQRGTEQAFIRDLKQRPAEELVNRLADCVDTHQSIKTGKETPTMALTLLTLRFCGL